MGWKTLKDRYRIRHYVQVTSEGICIGSAYAHNLIVLGVNGAILKGYSGRDNEDLRRYMTEFEAHPEKLRDAIQATDVFDSSVPVFTYKGGEIVEKQCEQLGWPNATHDGCMMYENMFSSNKSKVVEWAKETARLSVKWRTKQIEDLRRQIAGLESDAAKQAANLKKLETDYAAEPER